METKGWTLLRILLSRSNDDLTDLAFQEAFLDDLPEEDALEILTIKSPGPHINSILEFPWDLLKTMHYSWLAACISSIPKGLQPHAISLFEPKQAKRLLQTLNLDPFEKSLSEPVKEFLISIIFQKLDTSTILPKAFLPSSQLRFLADLSKDDLVRLIDLLGIYDLVEETRMILDNKKIKSINRCLTAEQQRFSIFCLHQREKVASSRFDLSNWNGDCDELQKKIHLRGIARLGKALSGQSPQLIWYIIHTLDIGRGKILQKHVEKDAILKITPALSQQVLHTYNHLQQKSKVA